MPGECPKDSSKVTKDTQFMPHFFLIKTVFPERPVFKKERKPFNLFPLWFISPLKGILLVNVANTVWIKWINQFGILNFPMKMTCFNTTPSLGAGNSLYLPVTLRMRFGVGWGVRFFAQCLHSVALLLSWQECDNFYPQQFCSCLLSSCPRAPHLSSWPGPAQMPFPPGSHPSLPLLNCSNVSSSGTLMAWNISLFCVRVTGYAHLISLLERDSCVIGSSDTHRHSDK